LNKIVKNLFGFIFLIPLIFPFIYKIWFRPFGISFNLLEVFIGISFFSFAVFEIFGEEKEEEINSREIKIFLYGLYLLFVGIFVGIFYSENKKDAFGILKSWFIFPTIFGTLIYKFTNSRKKIEDLVFSFGFGAFLLGFISIFIGIFNSNFWLDGRLRGFFETPNYISLYLIPIYIFFSTMWIFINNKFFKNFSIYLSLFIFGIILLAKSRIGIFFLGTPFFIFLFDKIFQNKNSLKLFKKEIFFMLTAFIISIFSILLIWDKKRIESSDSVRIEIWKESVKMIQENPFFGIGISDFQNEFSKRTEDKINFPEYIIPNALHPHNLFFAFYLQTGILGLIGFSLMSISSITLLIKFLKQQNEKLHFLKINSKNNQKEIENIKFFNSIILSSLFSILSIIFYGIFDTTIWKNDLSLQISFLFSLSFVISLKWKMFDL